MKFTSSSCSSVIPQKFLKLSTVRIPWETLNICVTSILGYFCLKRFQAPSTPANELTRVPSISNKLCESSSCFPDRCQRRTHAASTVKVVEGMRRMIGLYRGGSCRRIRNRDLGIYKRLHAWLPRPTSISPEARRETVSS